MRTIRSAKVLVFAGFAIGVGCSEGQNAFTGKPDDQHAKRNDQAPPSNTQNPPGSDSDPAARKICEDYCFKVPVQCRTNDCVPECLAETSGGCGFLGLERVQCATYRGTLTCVTLERPNDEAPLRHRLEVDGCDAERAAVDRCLNPDPDAGGGRGGRSGEGGAGGEGGRGPGGAGGDAGAGGSAGMAGDAGAGGTSGSAGTGTGGVSGAGASGGSSGAGGTSGTTGDGGPGGTGGTGASGGTAGVGGSAGTGGTSATGGTGGTDNTDAGMDSGSDAALD